MEFSYPSSFPYGKRNGYNRCNGDYSRELPIKLNSPQYNRVCLEEVKWIQCLKCSMISFIKFYPRIFFVY